MIHIYKWWVHVQKIKLNTMNDEMAITRLDRSTILRMFLTLSVGGKLIYLV